MKLEISKALAIMLLCAAVTLAHGDDLCVEDEGRRFVATYESLGSSLTLYDRGKEEFVFSERVQVKTKRNSIGHTIKIFSSESVEGRVNITTGAAYIKISTLEFHRLGATALLYELFDLSIFNTSCPQ